jgi:hypothetical protein
MTSFLRDIEFCGKWVTKFCNQHPSVPLSHAMNMKKKHDVKLLADKIQYSRCSWNVCADLKIFNEAKRRLYNFFCMNGRAERETVSIVAENSPEEQ